MQQRGLIHPRLQTHIGDGHYPSLCVIRDPNATQNEYGDPIDAPLDLPGHVDIPCRIAPTEIHGEQRESLQVYAEATYRVVLVGYYPQIESTHIAVVDGTTYQIEGPAQFDGNDTMTRLHVREVN